MGMRTQRTSWATEEAKRKSECERKKREEKRERERKRT